MLKRFVCVMFVFALAVVAFVACGNNNDNGAPDVTADTTAGSDVAREQTDEERWFGPFDETVTIRLAVPVNAAHEFLPGESYGYNIWTRAWRDYLNIEVEIMWEAVHAGGDYETRLNLAIATGEVPDLIRFENATQFDNMRTAGRLVDLTDYFANYAYPVVHELMGLDGGEALSWGTVGGSLYGLPDIGIMYGSPRMLFMRRDWFEDTGLDMPTTIEEWFHAARTMADADPANRFAIGQDNRLLRNHMADLMGPANAFGAQPNAWVEDGQGGLVWGTLDTRMMYVLEIYADLFAQGYIDQGFTTLTGGPLGEQLTSDRIAAISSATWLPGWPLAAAFEADGTDWIIQPILPSETLDGPLRVQADAPAGRLSAVRAGFEHPEAIFKIFNFATAVLEDNERARLDEFHPRGGDSPFGFHFPNPMQNPTTHRNLTNFARYDRNTDFLTQAHCWQNIEAFEGWMDGAREGVNWSSWLTWYGDYSTWGILTNYIDRGQVVSNLAVGVQTPTMLTNWADLIDLEDTFMIEVVTGQRPVSDFEDFFIPTWHAMGGAIITDEINEWWRESR